MNRREFLAAAAALAAAPLSRCAPDDALYAMDTWFWQERDLDLAAQAALLRKLGYAGLALSWGQKHVERGKVLRDSGLGLPGIYVTAEAGGPYPGHLAKCVDFLRGSGGLVWLAVTSKAKRSDPAGDEAAAALVGRCADDCTAAGVAGVALYPHAGFWMERTGDAVRVAERLRRPDVGVQFNHYHWMAAEGGQDLRKTLDHAKPWLRGVSINGSGRKPSILPLGEGDYDVLPLLRELAAIGYDGPVSHQGYSIQGNLPARLEGAMRTWRALATAARAVQARVFVSGIVQGVGFRASTVEAAKERGVTGWVRNLDDGRVEAVIQGPKEKVEDFVAWCRKGPLTAKVEKVDVTREPVTETFGDFTIR